MRKGAAQIVASKLLERKLEPCGIDERGRRKSRGAVAARRFVVRRCNSDGRGTGKGIVMVGGRHERRCVGVNERRGRLRVVTEGGDVVVDERCGMLLVVIEGRHGRRQTFIDGRWK